jgi:alanyl-tRNA synthetase
MKPDKEIKKEFRPRFWADPDKYYATSVLKEEGFARKICPKCKKPFWATDAERKVCGDPACSGEGFAFIGNTPAKRKLSYVDVWLEFSKMFQRLGYTPIKRYPVVARWNPTMEYTNSSIAAFQPYVISGEVEPPANPLVIPQFCLRFNDIDNVGITQSHHTGFVMIGQHMFVKPEKWDQNRVFRDIYTWLNKGLGLGKDDIIFHEDAWAGGGNFGPCMEFFSRGCELGNQVYMLYEQTPAGNKELGIKVLDMGMGHERNAWFSQGCETIYDAAFPDVVSKLVAKTGVKIDKHLMKKYIPHASLLNIDETDDIEKAWKTVAKNVGIDVKELRDFIMPLSGVYSIAEHARTLLFALTDGGLPSNVGGGYNLRMLARRAMSFDTEYGWNIDLPKVCEWHASYLKPIFPELSENIDDVVKILEVERSKYESTRVNSVRIVAGLLKKGVDERELLKLYDSHGIPPEIIKEEFEKHGKKIKIPDDFYSKVSGMHEKQKQIAETGAGEKLPLNGMEDTKILYYNDYSISEFDAKVVKVIGDNVVLDRTAFYPTSGGQLHDKGKINGKNVIEIFKQGGIVVHKMEPHHDMKEGQAVSCAIDKTRRLKLSQQHTATHILNAAARAVLGRHVNQAGAKKTEDKSHLDITHYLPITSDEIKKMEELANRMAARGIAIEKLLIPRNEAEKRFGMRIYQGGAVPGKLLRIVNVPGIDVEACGGTHLNNTSEVGVIKILKVTKIQDGIDRIEFTAGAAAEKIGDEEAVLMKDVIKGLQHFASFKHDKNPSKDLRDCADVFSVSIDQVGRTVEKFSEEINTYGKKLGKRIAVKRVKDIKEACEHVFELYKTMKKDYETQTKDKAGSEIDAFLMKAKNNEIIESVNMEKKEMLQLCDSLVSKHPEITVILVNKQGEVVGASERKDISKEVRHLCERCCGSGGGKGRMAQGKLDIAKFESEK